MATLSERHLGSGTLSLLCVCNSSLNVVQDEEEEAVKKRHLHHTKT